MAFVYILLLCLCFPCDVVGQDPRLDMIDYAYDEHFNRVNFDIVYVLSICFVIYLCYRVFVLISYCVKFCFALAVFLYDLQLGIQDGIVPEYNVLLDHAEWLLSLSHRDLRREYKRALVEMRIRDNDTSFVWIFFYGARDYYYQGGIAARQILEEHARHARLNAPVSRYDPSSQTNCTAIVPYFNYEMIHLLSFGYLNINEPWHFRRALDERLVYDYRANEPLRLARLSNRTYLTNIPLAAASMARVRRARLNTSISHLLGSPPAPAGMFYEDDYDLMRYNYHFIDVVRNRAHPTSRFEVPEPDATEKQLLDVLKHSSRFGKSFDKAKVKRDKERLLAYSATKKSKARDVERAEARDMKYAYPTSMTISNIVDSGLFISSMRAIYNASPSDRPIQLILLFRAMFPDIYQGISEETYTLVVRKLHDTPDFFNSLFESVSITVREFRAVPTSATLEDLKSSPMYKHAHKIGCWIVGMLTSAYFKTRFEHIAAIVEKVALFAMSGDLIADLLAAGKAVVENFYCFYNSGDVNDLLYGDPDSKLFLEQLELLTCLSEVKTQDELNELKPKIENWKDAIKSRMLFHRVSKSTTLNFSRWIEKMQEGVRLAEKNVSSCTPSRPPFVIQFQGPPSVAKTRCALQALAIMQRHEGYTPGAQHIWSKVSGDKYASGFTGQRFFFIDDAGAEPYVPGAATSMTSLLSIVGCMTQPAIMAEAQDKGKYMYEPYAIVLTSNVRNLGLYKEYVVGQAALRRIVYLVLVRVKDEFSKPRTSANDIPILDKAKLVGHDINSALLFMPLMRELSNSQNEPQGITEVKIIDESKPSKLVEGEIWYEWNEAFQIIESEYVKFRTHSLIVQSSNASIFTSSTLCTRCRKVFCTCVPDTQEGPVESAFATSSVRVMQFWHLIMYYYHALIIFLTLRLYHPAPGNVLEESAALLDTMSVSDNRARLANAVKHRVLMQYPEIIERVKLLLGMITSAAAMYGAVKLYRASRVTPTGLEMTIGGVTKTYSADYKEGKVDVLSGNYYPITGPDIIRRPNPVVRQLPPTQAMTTPDSFLRVVRNNICKITLINDDLRANITGCFLNERTIVTVAHAFPVGFAGSLDTVGVELTTEAGTTNTAILSGVECYQSPGVDCMFFVFKPTSPRPKLRQFVIHEFVGEVHVEKALLFRFTDTGVTETEVDVTLTTAEWSNGKHSFNQACWSARHYGSVGESGALLVTKDSHKILGIQTASTAANLPDVFRAFKDVHTYFGFIPELPGTSESSLYGTSMSFPYRPIRADFVAADTTEYSLSNNIDPGPMNVIGRISNFTRSAGKTAYVPTAINNKCGVHRGAMSTLTIGGFTSKTWCIPDLQPRMKKFVENGTEYCAWKSPLMWPVGTFNARSCEPCSALIDVCLKDYMYSLDDLPTPARPQGKASLMQVLNGVEGLSSVNLNSSAGYGFAGKIKDYIVEKDGKRCLKKEYLYAYQDYITKLAAGTVPMSPFKASVKDEIVGEKKHVLGKNRIFFGGSFFAYLASKQYLGPIISYMHTHGEVFESAIGINCQGPEWAKKRDKLFMRAFRKCLDFENFDLWIKYMIKEKFHNVLERVMTILGVDEMDPTYRSIVHHLFEEFLWMTILIGEEIFVPHTGLPSGMFGTTDLGCFVVSMLYRLVWFSCDEVDPSDYNMRFRSWNWLMTYGDDNTSNTAMEWFSQTRMREVLLDYNIKITSASKSDELLPFTPDNEITFLKRGFYDTTLFGKRVVLCPLEEDSIARSIMFTSAPEETRKGVEASNIFDAQKQYFFHGREVYDDRVPALRRLAESAGIDISIVNGKWYSFDELARQYLDGVLVTDYV